MNSTNRNAPCPCGSGKKYKLCCFQGEIHKKTIKKRNLMFFLLTCFILLTAGIAGKIIHNSLRPGPYDELAQCLSARGYTLYGTHWCGNCTEQKKLFGKSFKHIAYIECSPGGSREVSDFCKENGIRKIPTWVGPGNERYVGVQSITELSGISSCDISDDMRHKEEAVWNRNK